MVTLSNLPNREQIRALTDMAALERLRDDILAEVIQIEAQLENPTRDADWQERAVNALAAFRFAHRITDQQIERVRQDRKATVAIRPESHIAARTRACLSGLPEVDPACLQSHEDVDAALAETIANLEAVRKDREDEIAQPPIERDEAFLSATRAAERFLSGRRASLQARRGQITRALRQAENDARQTRRERLFIDAARTLLPDPKYRDLWAEVDRMEAAQATEVAHD